MAATLDDRPPDPQPDGHAEVLAALRRKPVNVHVFGGYGPLVVGLILVVLMLLLAPSVARERVVERPAQTPTTVTTVTTPTTVTTVPAP